MLNTYNKLMKTVTKKSKYNLFAKLKFQQDYV